MRVVPTPHTDIVERLDRMSFLALSQDDVALHHLLQVEACMYGDDHAREINMEDIEVSVSQYGC